MKKGIVDSNQGEKIDKGLLKIARNILSPRDVRTKANFWNSQVIIYKGWTEKRGWTRNFTFLPHVDDYKAIKEEIIQELETAIITPCSVLNSTNNVMTFTFQPLSHKNGEVLGIDFFRPDVVLFFKGGKKNNWKQHAVMYRIIGTKYVDTRKLTLEITAKKDYCWLYHYNVMSSPARVRVLRSQLIRYDDKGYEYPDVCFSVCGDLRRVRYLAGIEKGSGRPKEDPGKPKDAEWQPKFRLMYTNVDLRKSGIENRITDAFFMTTPEGCHIEDCDGTGTNCSNCPKMPQTLLIKEVDREISESTTKNATDIHFFLFPREMKILDGNVWPTYYIDKTGRDGQKWIDEEHYYSNAWEDWLPEPFNEQPHLIASEHSSAQFYFMRKLINSITLNQCRITHEKENGELDNRGGLRVKGKKKSDEYGKVKHVLQYKVFTKASIAGICYHFETGSQWFRVELKVKGFAPAKDYFWDTIESFRGTIGGWLNKQLEADENDSGWGAVKKAFIFIASGLVAAAPGWIAGYIKNMKTNPEKFLKERGLSLKEDPPGDTPTTQTGTDAKDKGGGSNVSGGTTSEETVELASEKKGEAGRIITKESYEREVSKAKREEIGKISWDTLGKTVQRATSFANTINIDYDPGEFFNRSQKNPFEIRYEFSNQLYDALYNNNNLAVAQELDNRIACLNNLVNPKLGAQEIQADIELFYDGEIGMAYKNAFAKGITFYSRETFDEDFPQLNLQHANVASFALSLRASDPGMEGGQVDIEGQQDRQGQTVSGRDHISTTATAVWVHESSYIRKEGASEVEGMGLFASLINQLPSDWFKGNKFEQRPGYYGHWTFKEGESRGEVSFDIPPGKYTYWVNGYDRSLNSPPATEEYSTTAVFWLEGINQPCSCGSPGCGSKGGFLHLRLDSKGQQKIDISKIDIPPMVPTSDDTMPDMAFEGGRGNPTGGESLSDEIEDIDEMTVEDEFSFEGGAEEEIPLEESQEQVQEEEDEGQQDLEDTEEMEEEEEEEQETQQEEDQSTEEDEQEQRERENQGEEEIESEN